MICSNIKLTGPAESIRIDGLSDSRVESKGFRAMELQRKLEILADAAKYDASCPFQRYRATGFQRRQGVSAPPHPVWASAIAVIASFAVIASEAKQSRLSL